MQLWQNKAVDRNTIVLKNKAVCRKHSCGQKLHWAVAKIKLWAENAAVGKNKAVGRKYNWSENTTVPQNKAVAILQH